MILLADIIQPDVATPTTETISLTAIINTALCVGAGGSSGSLANKPILKNSEGRLVIPASQLKGRLRHECEKLARGLGWPVCESPAAAKMCPQIAKPREEPSYPSKAEWERAKKRAKPFRIDDYRLQPQPGQPHGADQHHCLICQLFGNPSLPARLQFSDLRCTAPEDSIPDVLRPGVSINRRRRTAEEQKLYFLEKSPANIQLRFEGELHLQQSWTRVDETAAPFAKALILTGLKHIYALGGSKSTGLGWLHWELKPDDMTIPDASWAWQCAKECAEERSAARRR